MIFLPLAKNAIECFTLLDVGVSGGIDPQWKEWGAALVAHGFDPILDEIDRLQRAEQNEQVRYHAAYVTCDDYDELQREKPNNVRSNASFHLTSAWRAVTKASTGIAQKMADRRLSLDQFAADFGVNSADFIKTDTDGYDYYVLRGARRLLSSALGVKVECNFHGENWEHGNNFANIDRLLRSHGFTLFDIAPWRYTRAALPGMFAFGFLGQTTNGQVQWADAVYFRDPCIDTQCELSPHQILKLLALYEAFGFPDCAAQLLLMLRDQELLPEPVRNVDAILDALVAGNEFGIKGYDRYVNYFEDDARRFFPAKPFLIIKDIASRSSTTRSLFRRLQMRLKQSLRSY